MTQIPPQEESVFALSGRASEAQSAQPTQTVRKNPGKAEISWQSEILAK